MVLTSTTSTFTPALILRDRHVCGATEHVNQAWLELSGNKLDGVVVYLELKPAPKQLQPKRVEIDQKNCTYLPRMIAVPARSSVRFKNSDPVLHNVHLYDPEGRTVANWAMPTKAQTTDWIPLKRPGRYRAGCDAGHSWMNVHIFVFDHPHFVLSSGGGLFSMKRVPAGEYRLVAWHPDLGARGTTVKVGQKGRVEVRVEF